MHDLIFQTSILTDRCIFDIYVVGWYQRLGEKHPLCTEVINVGTYLHDALNQNTTTRTSTTEKTSYNITFIFSNQEIKICRRFPAQMQATAPYTTQSFKEAAVVGLSISFKAGTNEINDKIISIKKIHAADDKESVRKPGRSRICYSRD